MSWSDCVDASWAFTATMYSNELLSHGAAYMRSVQ